MDTNSNKKAIFICGPTAVGKTNVAIKIAKWLNTDIISFDSRQFYTELKIGAAPPSKYELKEVKHHFIAHLSVTENLSAGEYEFQALEKLNELFKNHNSVVLVGGSGLYMKAVTEGFDNIPKVKESIREKLNDEFEELGLNPLLKELHEKDPDYFNQVDKQNPQRVIRALEVIRSSGKAYSGFRGRAKKLRPFDCIKLALNIPRERLYERINQRVDAMLEAGLEMEVKSLLAHRNQNALQTVGYKEFFQHFDGDFNLEKAIDEIKKNSRRYAKRQLTWFKKDEEIHWFEPTAIEEIKSFISQKL